MIVQNQVRDCVLRTFGYSIYIDLWRNIGQTTRTQQKNNVLENIVRFREKQCSNSFDLVYSILSISTDGPRLRVNYEISRTRLVRNVLRLMGDDLCLDRIARLLQILPLSNDEGYLPSAPFLNVETNFVEHLGYQHKRCLICGTNIDLAPLRKKYTLGNAYVRCLLCTHAIMSGRALAYDHLFVIETFQLSQPSLPNRMSQSKWRVFCHSRVRIPNLVIWELEGCLITAPVSPFTRLMICLTVGALCRLAEFAVQYGPWHVGGLQLPQAEASRAVVTVHYGLTLVD